MIDQIKRHGLFDIDIHCDGDLEIDDHHTVEDCGITLGQAFAQALGDKKVYVVMVIFMHHYEAFSCCCRFIWSSGFVYGYSIYRARIGTFDVDLFSEFFQGL
jgi:imidazoleglycerol-phosphate dehydratase